ncbi:hypothetical protein [Butyrivibrio fibrisolvens]|uniref:hypothetical protein n=1 Tax=Butyrivibrio fibrisolvens TaxID=831 RepID=UPI0003B3E644|nr:hypothetical protein [Butyrivibrio fibrisolvens]
MVVSIILDTEYMGDTERFKWFLKNVTYAKKNGWILVTHESIKKNLKELLLSCNERFYPEFEMEKTTVEEIEKLDICYVPDRLFEDVYKQCGSRTSMILELTNNRTPAIEEYIIGFINDVLDKKYGQRVLYIMNCLHVFASVKYLADYYDCQLLPYVFSAVRKVHGYTSTLYMAHFDKNLFETNVVREMYSRYIESISSELLLNRKEIMALLGKRHNLVLIPLMDCEGVHEVGVIKEAFQITPQTFAIHNVTDDDLYYELSKRNIQDIQTRMHPLTLDLVGIGRKHIKNDPAAFILGCKRLVSLHSQMIIKAAMWNRGTCVIEDQMPYSFLLSHDLLDNTPINEVKLNFILFGYFVPDALMFDESYWKWRMTNPSMTEVVKKHLAFLYKNIGMSQKDYISENRLLGLLQSRGCSSHEIELIKNGEQITGYPVKYPSSKISVMYNKGSIEEYYTLNQLLEGGGIRSEFVIDDAENIEMISVSLLFDTEGTVKNCIVQINNDFLEIDDVNGYREKNKPQFVFRNVNYEKVSNVVVEWCPVEI